MGKNKLAHFEENRTFPNVFQPEFREMEHDYPLKMVWGRNFFKNTNPLILELGCGKGEYTLGLAKRYPKSNFIGIDNKGARIWRGAKTSQLENIRNAAFLRIKIEQVPYCFGEDEVDEIWITFPDPVPKARKSKKRLTSGKFLDVYKSILKPGGLVHLKTDNAEFFNFTLESIKEFNIQLIFCSHDIYNSGYNGDASQIQTYYEEKYLKAGIDIKYLQFRFIS